MRHAKPSKNTLDRLHALSKQTKGTAVFIVFWTAFVIYRTADSHYLLGFYLSEWDDGDFLSNWLVVPTVVAALLYGVRWTFYDRKNIPKPNASPLTVFESAIAGWPAPQGKKVKAFHTHLVSRISQKCEQRDSVGVPEHIRNILKVEIAELDAVRVLFEKEALGDF